MSNVLRFKSAEMTLAEAIAIADDYKHKASSAWTHYLFRACDKEHAKHKKFKRLQYLAEERVKRLAKVAMENLEFERKFQEAFK